MNCALRARSLLSVLLLLAVAISACEPGRPPSAPDGLDLEASGRTERDSVEPYDPMEARATLDALQLQLPLPPPEVDVPGSLRLEPAISGCSFGIVRRWESTEQQLFFEIQEGVQSVGICSVDRPHDWFGEVRDGRGSPIDDAELRVEAARQDGFSMPVEVRGVPDGQAGRYRLEGMRFDRPGDWTVWVWMRAGEVSDMAVFSLEMEWSEAAR